MAELSNRGTINPNRELRTIGSDQIKRLVHTAVQGSWKVQISVSFSIELIGSVRQFDRFKR